MENQCENIVKIYKIYEAEENNLNDTSYIDMELLKTKIKTWTSKIDKALEEAKEGNDGKKLKDLKEKIKEYRQSGLEKEGELSYENLVFKYLRRSGYIGRLFELKTKLKDKELSIERKTIE